MKYILTLFFLLNVAFAQDSNLYKAHAAYDDGDYDKAADIYKSVYPKVVDNGYASYNLGNIYYRNGELGKSIFYFRMAKRFLPRSADVKYNLSYVRSKAIDKIEESSKSFFSFVTLKNLFSFRERVFLLSFVSLVFWILTIVFIFNKREWVRWAQRSFLVLFIITSIVFVKDYFSTGKFGVVTASEAKVYSAIGKDNVVLFTLHEGAEFSYEDIVDKDWLQISLKDGKKGWIRSNKIIK